MEGMLPDTARESFVNPLRFCVRDRIEASREAATDNCDSVGTYGGQTEYEKCVACCAITRIDDTWMDGGKQTSVARKRAMRTARYFLE